MTPEDFQDLLAHLRRRRPESAGFHRTTLLPS